MAKLHQISWRLRRRRCRRRLDECGSGSEAHCVRAGGEATMITEDLAKFMSQAALKNSIAGMGAKPVGPISLKCTTGPGLPYCIAKQKACK